MTLLVTTPVQCSEERRYTLGVIFDEFLCLPWQWGSSVDEYVHIQLSGAVGEIRIPDLFFSKINPECPAPTNLPALPLDTWDTRELAADITLTEPVIPVIYGSARSVARLKPVYTGAIIDLPIDVFGSVFFMLSRYEETVIAVRDNHDRFPATASLAYRAGFLDRPIVDEYVEILWAAMRRLWPNLFRKSQSSRTLISCDVDSPFEFDGKAKNIVRRLAVDLVKRHDLQLAARNLYNEWEVSRGFYKWDRFRCGIDWIMTVNEAAGNCVSFNFIPFDTHPKYDNRYNLSDPRIRRLVKEIHARGHEIGIHPGYNTYANSSLMNLTVKAFRKWIEDEGVKQAKIGGRQHYLRWESPTTARLWEASGLDYDSTLGFADQPGFRCGTCREYSIYDLFQRRKLSLRERPLIVMECSVMSDTYMGLNSTLEAIEIMTKLRDQCRLFGGDFTLLWHNSFRLERPEYQDIYRSLISD